MTTVEVVGSGPAVESLVAALGDTAATVRRADDPLVRPADLAVVVGQVTSERFGTASDRARELGTPWVAVELGGIGGVPVADASVAGFGPETGCYHCLTERVRANVDQQQPPAEAPTSGTQRFAGAVAGRRIEHALTGAGPLAGTVVELPHTERQFLPVPGCACGGSRSWTLRHGDGPDHELEALSRAEGGLDERVGIVSEVGEAESFPAPYYLATVADTDRFSDVAASQQAAGVSSDWDTAFMKALGESYERYAAGVYTAGDLPLGTAADVADAVAPTEFVRPEGGATDESLRWLPAEHLGTGTEVDVPAETVLYPPPSRTVRPPVTTGLGLGSSETDALLSGLYEVLERDAAMLSWYSTYDPLEIAVENAEEFDALRRRAHSEDLTVTVLSLTQDIDVPVVAVALQGEQWPKFAIGSAAGLDPEAAAVGALEEALQNWMELRGMGRTDAADAAGAIGHYAGQPDAASSLTDTATAVSLSNIRPDSVPEGDAELSALVDRATAAGLDPYATRLTTPDLEQLGFEAVRVLCPTAQPLFFDDAYFGERAERVPGEMGFEPRLDRAHHPFP
jgi:ribosomal protein S12 methylthiotransferase accessory factor